MEAISEIDRSIGNRVRTLRSTRGLTLDDLAESSGVSRAMLSRIERGESSPTAQLLNRVCGGLGVTLSALLAAADPPASPLRRRKDQPIWLDPGVGYKRRVVSPPGTGSPAEIVEVEFPSGAAVAFENLHLAGVDQHVWVLDGAMEVAAGDDTYRVEKGDCLHMPLDRAIRFRNPTDRAARYAVVIARGGKAR